MKSVNLTLNPLIPESPKQSLPDESLGSILWILAITGLIALLALLAFVLVSSQSLKAKTVGDDFAEYLYQKRVEELYPLYQWLAIARGAKTPQEIDTFVNTAIQESKSQWRQQDAARKRLSSHVLLYP